MSVRIGVENNGFEAPPDQQDELRSNQVESLEENKEPPAYLNNYAAEGVITFSSK
jgi:hypothetical protein